MAIKPDILAEPADTEEVTADDIDAARLPLPELFMQLSDDGKRWLRAEVAVYREEARRRLIGAAIVAGLFSVAAVIAFAALSASFFGIILALTPWLGAGWATGAVLLGGLVVAGLLGIAGRWQLRRLMRTEPST